MIAKFFFFSILSSLVTSAAINGGAYESLSLSSLNAPYLGLPSVRIDSRFGIQLDGYFSEDDLDKKVFLMVGVNIMADLAGLNRHSMTPGFRRKLLPKCLSLRFK